MLKNIFNQNEDCGEATHENLIKLGLSEGGLEQNKFKAYVPDLPVDYTPNYLKLKNAEDKIKKLEDDIKKIKQFLKVSENKNGHLEIMDWAKC